MAHHREVHESDGHRVVIQQVTEGGEIKAWIDQKAAYLDSAFQQLDQVENALMRDLVEDRLSADDRLLAIRALVTYMTDEDLYFCRRCDNFYDSDESVSGGFAGHVCGQCDDEIKDCPKSNSGHEWKVTNPRHKHNARMPTKRTCQHCGQKTESTPTG